MRWMLAIAGICLSVLAFAGVLAAGFEDLKPPAPVPSLTPVSSSPPTSNPSNPSGTGGGGATTGTSTASNTQTSNKPSTPYIPPGSATGGASPNPITSPYQEDIDPLPNGDEEFIPAYPEDEGVEMESPSGISFFSATTLLLLLVPIAIGAGAWYVLVHRKPQGKKGKGSTGTEPQIDYSSLQMEQPIQQQPPVMQQRIQQPASRIQFDPVTLRKAKQYVASLRVQNIPDHKIARAMREADWPAAYIEESMKE